MRGIGPDLEQLDELGARSVPEVIQVRLIPHFPILDRTLVAAHRGIHEVVPVLKIARSAVGISGRGGPAWRVAEPGVDMQPARIGFGDGVILNRPIELALARRLDAAP